MKNSSFRFYLYDINYHSEYSASIYEALEDNALRTDDPDNANIFITCFSNERHYPEYGILSPSIDSSIGPARDVIPALPYFDRGRHVVFYHTDPPFRHENLINIPYCSRHFDGKRDFIICPPALSRADFDECKEKEYLLSFKGDQGREPDRSLRLNVLRNIRNQNIRDCAILRRDEQPGYQDLIKSSVFSLVVDGDCHWSYRLTEVINMGSIPVIVTDGEWTNTPFSNILDYSSFSILIDKDDISDLKRILETMPESRISQLRASLFDVNERYFKTRKRQLEAMLGFLSSVYPDVPAVSPIGH